MDDAERFGVEALQECLSLMLLIAASVFVLLLAIEWIEAAIQFAKSEDSDELDEGPLEKGS